MAPILQYLAVAASFGSLLVSGATLEERQAASQQLFNGSYCSYTSFQANVVGRKLLMFGGNLTVQPRSPSGQKMKRAVQNEFQFFSILLNNTFKTTSTPATFVQREPDPVAKKKVANIVDGTAFSYGDSLYFYGGQQTFNAAPSNSIFKCTPAIEANKSKIAWDNNDLNGEVSRVTTRGAGLMANTEDKGFYFGGQGFEPARNGADGDPVNPPAGATGNLIVSSFSDKGQTWKNITTSNPDIKPYTDGNLVFIPQGKEGCLAAVGGQFNGQDGSWNSIPMFDIATSTWFLQPTTGDLSSGSSKNPGPSTCSVVKSSPDSKTHYVYVYGGKNRIKGQSQLAILTLPAFHWTVVEDSSYPPRSEAQCMLVGANQRQMLIVGGSGQGDGDTNENYCNNGEGFVLLLDLSGLEFEATFPNDAEYTLPSIIQNLTSVTAPLATGGWSSTALSNAYNVGYQPLAARNQASSNKGPIIGGVVGGIGGALILSATAIFLFRHKRKPVIVDNTSKTAGANEPFLNQYNNQAPQPSPGFAQPQPSPGYPPTYASPAFSQGAFAPTQDYKADQRYSQPVSELTVPDQRFSQPSQPPVELPPDQRYSQPSQPPAELGGDNVPYTAPVELDGATPARR